MWIGDHLLYEFDGRRVGPWEAWTRLAALAEATSRVTIGPLVAVLPCHPPAVLAKMAATLDEISDPGEVWRSVALLLQFGFEGERRNSRNPILGPPDQMAEALARAVTAGVDEVQLVLDPITLESVELARDVVERSGVRHRR